jgi:hypothetical protein
MGGLFHVESATPAGTPRRHRRAPCLVPPDDAKASGAAPTDRRGSRPPRLRPVKHDRRQTDGHVPSMRPKRTCRRSHDGRRMSWPRAHRREPRRLPAWARGAGDRSALSLRTGASRRHARIPAPASGCRRETCAGPDAAFVCERRACRTPPTASRASFRISWSKVLSHERAAGCCRQEDRRVLRCRRTPRLGVEPRTRSAVVPCAGRCASVLDETGNARGRGRLPGFRCPVGGTSGLIRP